MRLVTQHGSHDSEENAKTISAIDLAIFVETLRGERVRVPARVETQFTLTEVEQRMREQAQRERELLTGLLKQFKRKSRQRKLCMRLFVLTGGLAFVMGVMMMLNAASIEVFLAPFELAAAIALGVMCVGSRMHSQMTTLVANIPESDIRAIGPLLEAMGYADMEGIPQRALKELLPQLEPADAVLFTDAHRHCLHLALDDVNTDLVILLLKALEKIGDGRSVAAVQKLANGGGRARVDPLVLRAAQHCLPLLEARAVYDTANQTLLRASALEPEKGASLLRSVDERPDAAPRELLRPTEAQDTPAME